MCTEFLLQKSKLLKSFDLEISRRMTIFALSTHPGRAAVAVIRVSGQASQRVLKQLSRRTTPRPRVPVLRTLYEPPLRELTKTQRHVSVESNFDKEPPKVLDRCLALLFQGPNSYTGEDVLELHVHGGTATVKAVMSAISCLSEPQDPIRQAEPGEFTLRAFQNNKMDLTQVEGLRDVIDAETEVQRQLAQNSALGSNSDVFELWRQKIVTSISLLTALIDFSDDNAEIEGTASQLANRTRDQMQSLLNDHITPFLRSASKSELVASGLEMCLIGPPNAGKSSILNCLVQREAAIVSDLPGTTRDVIGVSMDIGGYKVHVSDTAGLRRQNQTKSNDVVVDDRHHQIELFGMKKTREHAAKSDLIIAILPIDATNELVSEFLRELDEIAAKHAQEQENREFRLIIVLNKADLQQPGSDSNTEALIKLLQARTTHILQTSCQTNQGIAHLTNTIATACKELCFGDIPTSAATSKTLYSTSAVSHRVRMLVESHIQQGIIEFLACMDPANGEPNIVMALAELQLAVDGISRITGRGIGVEEVLGNVFSTFCIGK